MVDDNDSCRRYAKFQLSELERLGQVYAKSVQSALDQFTENELEQLKSAQAWAAELAASNHAARELCSRIPIAGADLLTIRQHPLETMEWLKAALDSAIALDNKSEMALHYQHLGNVHEALSQSKEAIPCFERALALAKVQKDKRLQDEVLGGLGNAHIALAQVRPALEYYQQQLTVSREIGDLRGQGNALGGIGSCLVELGEPLKAIKPFEEWLPIAEQLGDRVAEHQVYGGLCFAYAALDDAAMSLEYAEKKLKITVEVGDQRGAGYALLWVGRAHLAMGNARKSLDVFTEELACSKDIHDRLGEGYALNGMAAAQLCLGLAPAALKLCQQALAIQQEIQDDLGAMETYGVLGDVYRNLHQIDQASEYYKLQLATAQKIGKRHGIANALFNLSLVLESRGWLEEALASAREALEIFEDIGSKRTLAVRKRVLELTATN